MKPEEMRWLYEDEYRLYLEATEIKEGFDRAGLKASGNWMVWMVGILKHLARCRMLMKKYEWGRYDDVAPKGFCCYECGQKESEGHAPDCAWDAELDGLPGGGSNEPARP